MLQLMKREYHVVPLLVRVGICPLRSWFLGRRTLPHRPVPAANPARRGHGRQPCVGAVITGTGRHVHGVCQQRRAANGSREKARIQPVPSLYLSALRLSFTRLCHLPLGALRYVVLNGRSVSPGSGQLRAT